MSVATHAIRCRCGQLRGEVAQPHGATRAVCYCRDCQAFAHFLGLPAGMLDEFGGTDIVATPPRFVSLIAGAEQLACMSLSPQGTLRWYAACCNTPIGNTPRDRKLAHVGLVHSCLEREGASLEQDFGPVRMRVSRKRVHGVPPKAPAVASTLALARYLARLAWARVSGGYRANPFFDAAGAPRVQPRVLTQQERASFTPGG